MISNFKEKPDGGYYCSECRMSFGDLQTTCPYCGSFVSNYEELVVNRRGLRAEAGIIEDDPDYKAIMEILELIKEK